jgi:hypothetical protein
MAKKKRNRITPEDQRAFDERTKMIEQHLDRLRKRDDDRRASSAR